MYTIVVKFNTGLFRVFEHVNEADYRNDVLTISVGNKIVRMPLVNIMYFETSDSPEGVTIDGEGKVKE